MDGQTGPSVTGQVCTPTRSPLFPPMIHRCRELVGFCLLAIVTPVHAQNAHGGKDSGPAAERPVAAWGFDGTAEPGVPKDTARYLEPGPRPPTYPSFPATNTAFAFTGNRTGITVRESDLPKANLRFGRNESITLEAWVKVQELKDASYAYLVRNGRNRQPGFPAQN